MPDEPEPTLEETRKYIEELALRRMRGVPPEVISGHVIRITTGADFPLRRAAFEAIQRRWQKAQDDELVVLTAPSGGGVGRYVIGKKDAASGRHKRARARPYETEIENVGELRGQCSCPDYLKGSLALCKHLVVAFLRAFKRHREGASKRMPKGSEPLASVLLHWDPVIPLLGSGDRLSGLRVELRAGGEMPAGFKKNGQLDRRVLMSSSRRLERMNAWLAQCRANDGEQSPFEAGPAVIAMLESEIGFASIQQQSHDESESAIRALGSFKRELFPYQREAVERMLKSGRLLLADDMGLGKTTQAVAVCHALHVAGHVRRGLIITPATLKSQWLREWDESTDVPVHIVDGNAQQRAEMYRYFGSGFLIVNYEVLLRDFEQLVPFATELVVVDEAQRIKNYASKSAVYVKALPAQRRMILTGTPMENNLDELASLLDWIDDRALAPKWRLVPWYIQQESTASKARVGMRNLGTLRARIGGCVLRRSRKEVLTQLPKRTDTRVPVPLTVDQIAEHDELNQPIASLMRRAENRPLRHEEFLRLMTLLTQQRIISNGLGQLHFEELWPSLEKRAPTRALIDSVQSPKLDELRRLIQALAVDQGRKVVVFSQWRRMLRLAAWAVSDVLEAAGVRHLFFTGAESSKLRTQNLIDFHDDPTARVLFLTDAGGVGLNLQRAASVCVNIELPWNPAVLEQRIGRIYRLGQEQPIDVFNLVAEQGIESRIASIVGAKRALFEGVFESTSGEVKFAAAGSFVAEVRQLLDLPIPVVPEAAANESLVDAMVEAVEHLDLDGPSELDAPELDDSLPTTSPSEPLPTLLEPLTAGIEQLDTSLLPSTDDPASESASSTATSGSHESPITLDPASMTTMLGAMRVTSTPEGGLRIEAPREAAGALASLFEVMARALRASSS